MAAECTLGPCSLASANLPTGLHVKRAFSLPPVNGYDSTNPLHKVYTLSCLNAASCERGAQF